MINTVFAAVTSALLVAASPAMAEGTRTMPEPAATGPAPTQGAKPAMKPTRYCVKETVTGSRIERKSCQTREQWLAEGFDPLAK